MDWVAQGTGTPKDKEIRLRRKVPDLVRVKTTFSLR
jgi:hypothetical protein